MKVSIITACFNSEQTIQDTISSVKLQKYPNIEYIVFDGLSSDKTVHIIRKNEDIIHMWKSEKDSGISNAWNKALKYCTGDIVGIINADDMYQPDVIDVVVRTFRQNPAIDFVYGDVLMCDLAGNPLHIYKGSQEYTSQIIFDMPQIPHPTVFVRREIYNKFGGFNEAFKTAMDYEFLRKITSNGAKGLYQPEIFVKMRLGGESDHNYARGYREVMNASIAYGYNKHKAHLRYYLKVMKTSIRRKMESLGLNAIVKLKREYFGKRYRYQK